MLSFKFQFTWEVWISVSFLSRKSSLERLRDNLNWKFAEVLHLLTIPEKVSDLVWQADSISVVKHVHYLHSSLTKLHFRLDTVLIDKNLWGSNAKKQKKHTYKHKTASAQGLQRYLILIDQYLLLSKVTSALSMK